MCSFELSCSGTSRFPSPSPDIGFPSPPCTSWRRSRGRAGAYPHPRSSHSRLSPGPVAPQVQRTGRRRGRLVAPPGRDGHHVAQLRRHHRHRRVHLVLIPELPVVVLTAAPHGAVAQQPFRMVVAPGHRLGPRQPRHLLRAVPVPAAIDGKEAIAYTMTSRTGWGIR